jgi:hypothetical protein
MEGERIVGISTSNDVFYKVLNPLFGIGENGKRIIIYEAGEVEQMQKVLDCVRKAGLSIKIIWIPPKGEKSDLILHLETEDITQLLSHLKEMGLTADEREFAL